MLVNELSSEKACYYYNESFEELDQGPKRSASIKCDLYCRVEQTSKAIMPQLCTLSKPGVLVGKSWLLRSHRFGNSKVGPRMQRISWSPCRMELRVAQRMQRNLFKPASHYHRLCTIRELQKWSMIKKGQDLSVFAFEYRICRRTESGLPVF